MALPADFAGVRAARRALREISACWGLDEEARTVVELIVGELAGNAACHGRSETTVRLSDYQDWLRLSVTDSGDDTRPGRRPCSHLPGEHGRGLQIVRALAHSTVLRRRSCGWQVDVLLHVPERQPMAEH